MGKGGEVGRGPVGSGAARRGCVVVPGSVAGREAGERSGVLRVLKRKGAREACGRARGVGRWVEFGPLGERDGEEGNGRQGRAGLRLGPEQSWFRPGALSVGERKPGARACPRCGCRAGQKGTACCMGRESNPGLPRGRREFYH